jgi:hypothetical protein
MASHSYKNYLLVVLLAIFAFNWQDRLALGLAPLMVLLLRLN